jgi:perosamine synthetase
LVIAEYGDVVQKLSLKMIPHSKPDLDVRDFRRIQEVLESGMIADGSSVERLEEKLREKINNQELFCTNSGSHALILALKAVKLEEDDEVLLPTYVCSSVVKAVLKVGARPRLYDNGIDSWTVNYDSVKEKVTDKTKAIILVHTFGIYVDVSMFRKLNLPIIEDCCQAFDWSLNSEVARGDITVLSFHATKCLAAGRIGVIFTSEKLFSNKIKSLIKEERNFVFPSDIEATLGLSQLARYDEIMQKRRTIADNYFSYLPQDLTAPLQQVRLQSCFFRFPLRFRGGDFQKIAKQYELQGVLVKRGVDCLLHHNSAIKDIKYENAEATFTDTVSIPMYPALTLEMQKKVIMVTNDIYQNRLIK